MKFVWNLSEKTWEEFANAVNRGNFDAAYDLGEYLGCCRVGELCFDIRAWNGGEWTGWGFELFCGGVDSGYGYSYVDALKTGKYKDKYEVPDELAYPYDEVDYGEFPVSFTKYTCEEFEREAEKIFETFIKETYYEPNLVEMANKPLHVW